MPLLTTAPLLQFEGPGDAWSPETFLASIQSCFLFTLRAVARLSKLEFIDLALDAEGTVDRQDSVTPFTDVVLCAVLTVPAGTDRAKALAALEKTKSACLVSASISMPIRLVAQVQAAELSALPATVSRIEPAGFTKVSALRVEEQRVNVILDFVDPATASAALGDAFRVEVRVVLWESPSVLLVPTSALFRVGESWAVFTVDADRARRALVTLGHQTGQQAEVVSGLSEGARVILHPVDTLTDSARVKPTVR